MYVIAKVPVLVLNRDMVALCPPANDTFKDIVCVFEYIAAEASHFESCILTT